MTARRCPRCGEVKVLSEFYASGGACKTCRRAAARERRAASHPGVRRPLRRLRALVAAMEADERV